MHNKIEPHSFQVRDLFRISEKIARIRYRAILFIFFKHVPILLLIDFEHMR